MLMRRTALKMQGRKSERKRKRKRKRKKKRGDYKRKGRGLLVCKRFSNSRREPEMESIKRGDKARKDPKGLAAF
jgi:hypothetical protein